MPLSLGCINVDRTERLKPSPVAFSIERRLDDRAGDDRLLGETLDTLTCREDGTCTSEGTTKLTFTEERRLRVEWRLELAIGGRLESSSWKIWENEALDLVQQLDIDEGEGIAKASGSSESRHLSLPPGYASCEERCRAVVSKRAASPTTCDVFEEDKGFIRFTMRVRSIEHPRFGTVWEQITVKAGEHEERRRIVDANCQQLEAHMLGLHSKLLSEKRTGSPNVPPFSGPGFQQR